MRAERASKPSLYGPLFDHALTRVDAERAHQLAFRAIRAAGPALRALGAGDGVSEPVRALGLTFPNPLGLAAGFDKVGIGYDALAALGFGHVEIGTVTALPQPGNPRPRLFRLPADRAVVNRMGFNNDGAEAVARRLAESARLCGPAAPSRPESGRLGGLKLQRRADSRVRPVLGINIGKSKVVPDDDQAAVEADYATSTRLLAPYADYLVVNVSSPNTPGLRNLQAVERLAPLLAHVRQVADDARTVPNEKHPGSTEAGALRQGLSPPRVPLLVKIAPDLADDDVLTVADLAFDQRLDGIIATNTTITRDGLRSTPAQIEEVGAGGLSGAPLRERSTAVLRLLRERVGPELTLIGVGGISTAQDARDRLAAGATLVQAYTGFIYGGPLWPRRILKGLS